MLLSHGRSPKPERPFPKCYADAYVHSNFMSYRHMEMIDPGSKLNCIIGPNGSGKSRRGWMRRASSHTRSPLRPPRPH
eukprot:6188628-Pleurochrysis_carterae.AAC.1